jgi:hypothetical protein
MRPPKPFQRSRASFAWVRGEDPVRHAGASRRFGGRIEKGPPVASPPVSDVVLDQPPRAHARIAYLGPVSPHWEVYGDWGDRTVLDEFRARVLARLVLLPRDDPQFRRNRERIVRDAERELISLEWDLGRPDED